MNLKKIVLAACTLLIFFTSCEQNDVFPTDKYTCMLAVGDSSLTHPKANIYQNILERHRKNGLVGATLLVKDGDGLWMGADGMADIASDINVKPCNSFLIASISKVFTSAAVYRYVDQGVITLEDPISKWLAPEIVDKVENAQEAQIKHLLTHTSGIADFYTLQFELDRLNKISNNFTKEEVLEYTYGIAATHETGETYAYSNTNFLLLAMILERASGLTFEQVYEQEVFSPLGLVSAYYSEENPIPEGCVKGYYDIYGNGQYAESEFLYGDELGIGGDGGIAINAYDLALFLEGLSKGELISETSLVQMNDWFDLPTDWHWEAFGQTENGFGIEKFNTQYGYAVGHSGGIDGFSSLALYFPETDMTYILLVNSAGNEEGFESQEEIFREVMMEISE
ncbi:MAG: serine hydrolase [Bacteroidota bacterium]